MIRSSLAVLFGSAALSVSMVIPALGAEAKKDCSDIEDVLEYNACVNAPPKWVGGGDNTCAPSGNHGHLAPCEGEERHWGARPLVADRDWEILGVRYELYGGDSRVPGWNATCNPSLAHQVQLLIGEDANAPGLPESNPDVAANWIMPATSRSDGYHVIELETEERIVVKKGQTVFVTVKFNGSVDAEGACAEAGESLCVGACRNTSPTWSWSNANNVPYSWSTYPSLVEVEAGVLVRDPHPPEHDDDSSSSGSP